MAGTHYQEAFFAVASECNCWIGLREPNPLSAKWMGIPGFIPKGQNCKAKTADARQHHLAGLVVDPNLCPEAFESATMPQAQKKWKDFTANGAIPPGFSRVENGRDKGLIKFQGKGIYADFDLMSIAPADANGHFEPNFKNAIPGNTHYSAELHTLEDQVMRKLNQRLGIPLIQHGSEFSWTGKGAAESERVFFFGPKRQFRMGISSMPSTPDKWH